MASVYNNLASFGRIQMRIQSIFFYVLAVALIVGGLYFMLRKKRGENRRVKGVLGAVMFVLALLAVLIGWLLLYQTKQNTPASRLMAASSAVSFLNPF